MGRKGYDNLEYQEYDVNREESVKSLLGTDPFVKFGDTYILRPEIRLVTFIEEERRSR